MTKKVILPTEVAKAIEELRGEGLSSYGIITGMNTNGQGAFNTINQWSYKNGCRNTEKVLSAVVNGYEIEEVDFSKITDPEIYLGLIALSLEDDNYGWFLKGVADAFIQSSRLIIELLEDLEIARNPNHEPSEWYKGNNSPGPVVKNITFADKAEGEAFIAEVESKFEDESVSKEPETQEEHVAEIERARRRIQRAKDQETPKRLYVDDVMKRALDKIAQGNEENDGGSPMSQTTKKERYIPGVRQPLEEAMHKALMCLLETTEEKVVAETTTRIVSIGTESEYKPIRLES